MEGEEGLCLNKDVSGKTYVCVWLVGYRMKKCMQVRLFAAFDRTGILDEFVSFHSASKLWRFGVCSCRSVRCCCREGVGKRDGTFDGIFSL